MCATKWQRGLALIVLMNMAWTTACTSLQVVPLGDAPAQTLAVRIGESVRVTTKVREKRDFKVTAFEADALVGVEARVRYAHQMQQIEGRPALLDTSVFWTEEFAMASKQNRSAPET